MLINKDIKRGTMCLREFLEIAEFYLIDGELNEKKSNEILKIKHGNSYEFYDIILSEENNRVSFCVKEIC